MAQTQTLTTNTEFQSFRKEVKDEFQSIRREVSELTVAFLRMDAWNRNKQLQNPTLFIRSVPIPSLSATGGITEPDPQLFPRHATDFYSLRNPSTERQHRMLNYLIKFYDIAPGLQDSTPERAVEQLEDILGLQEDNFIAFRERAQQLATQASTATKRELQFSSGRDLQQRPRVRSPEDRPTNPRTPQPDSGSPTNLNTPTPPGGRPPRPQAVPVRPISPLPPLPSHHGTETNPFTESSRTSIPDTEVV